METLIPVRSEEDGAGPAVDTGAQTHPEQSTAPRPKLAGKRKQHRPGPIFNSSKGGAATPSAPGGRYACHALKKVGSCALMSVDVYIAIAHVSATHTRHVHCI
jgi:hypothetical protein